MGDENKRLDMSAVEIQQEYYEAVGDADWELFEKKDRKYLLQKVAVALCGPPSNEGDLIDGDSQEDEKLKLQGYEARDENTIMNVYNKIIKQAQYSHNGENLILSVLRIVCVIPSKNVPFYKVTPKGYWLNLHEKKGKSVHILVFHVFSLRKCISMKSEVKGCRIFIDHDARVYESWKAYLSENKLPKCVMIVPENGEYTGVIIKENEMPQVKLSVLASPELGPGAMVLNVADKMSTAANVGALVTVVVSVFAAPAVAPVMLSTAVGLGVATGVYGIGRSITNLVDRAQHEQSIGLKNSEARSSWINIMISTVGISFTTAGKLLSWAAASGRNVKILMSALEFLKYTNFATGFIGIANGLTDMIYRYARYREAPSMTELFQFTTSALFLGIGVMSNQTAQEIVQDAQANKINEIRDSLSSNNKRKIFDKVTAETRRVKGTIEGNIDVIRALKTIENKDEFFQNLRRINKSVNENKVRISLASDGKVLVNNSVKVSLSKMYRLGEEGRNKLFAKYGPAKVTTRNAPTRIYTSFSAASSSNAYVRELVCSIRLEEIIKISSFLVNLSKFDQDFIAALLLHISEQVHDAFLLLCAELITSLLPFEIECIGALCPDWKRRVILFVFDYLKLELRDNENDSKFMSILKSFIRDGKIHKDALLNLKEKLMDFFAKQKQKKGSRIDSFNDDYTWKYLSSLKTLRVGQALKVGPHTILMKQNTLDNFERRFQNYSQEQCDMFMELCFEIISILTKEEIARLNTINPDEDILMRVSMFLFVEFEKYAAGKSTVDSNMVSLAKCELLAWCARQRVRKHTTCKKCNGILYI